MTSDSRVLLIARHAKSSWSTGHTDHERPLNARGRADAPRVGRELAERGWIPELVLCSTAERTRETLAGFEEGTGTPWPVRYLDRLYLPELRDVLDEIGGLPDTLRAVMVLGHNPSCEEAVLRLAGEEIEVTTANVVRLTGSGSWCSLVEAPCRWTVTGRLRPREIDDSER